MSIAHLLDPWHYGQSFQQMSCISCITEVTNELSVYDTKINMRNSIEFMPKLIINLPQKSEKLRHAMKTSPRRCKKSFQWSITDHKTKYFWNFPSWIWQNFIWIQWSIEALLNEMSDITQLPTDSDCFNHQSMNQSEASISNHTQALLLVIWFMTHLEEIEGSFDLIGEKIHYGLCIWNCEKWNSSTYWEKDWERNCESFYLMC